jgi:hypothetical protein
MSNKKPEEKSSFVIVKDGYSVSFTANGSVIAGIVEASTWMPAARRETLIQRLIVKHAELTAQEAGREVSRTEKAAGAEGSAV